MANMVEMPAGRFEDDIEIAGEDSFLRRLGLVGLEELELPVLCSLVTGDPLLMVGTHGTAKTALAGAVASELGLDFHAYDASKALFEDIIGFPNPSALSRGELDYVPTSISLWNKEFILVDEISRATAQTQSKWLEVIRSRRLMGNDLPDLKYIFSAMNPPGDYQGARPLDPALAGRFAFIIEMPAMNSMLETDRLEVMETIGKDDAPLAQKLFKKAPGSNGRHSLARRIVEVRRRLPDSVDRYGEQVSRYLSRIIDGLGSGGEELKHLDGRRLGMIRRNFLVGLAIEKPENNRELGAVLNKLLRQSLPHAALDLECPRHRYDIAHMDAMASAFGTSASGEKQSIDARELLNRALERPTPHEALADLAGLSRVFAAYTDSSPRIDVSPELIGRIISTGRSIILNSKSSRFYGGEVAPFATSDTPAKSLAALLLSWWLLEKETEGTYQLDSSEVEKIEGWIAELAKLIKQREGDNQ